MYTYIYEPYILRYFLNTDNEILVLYVRVITFDFSQSFDTEIKSNLLEYYEFRNHTFQLNR